MIVTLSRYQFARLNDLPPPPIFDDSRWHSAVRCKNCHTMWFRVIFDCEETCIESASPITGTPLRRLSGKHHSDTARIRWNNDINLKSMCPAPAVVSLRRTIHLDMMPSATFSEGMHQLHSKPSMSHSLSTTSDSSKLLCQTQSDWKVPDQDACNNTYMHMSPKNHY
ncbi:Protein farnesyltransferase subunit beta [Fusarium oxysporum f. sp. albedinis]|nr:Protein farnesyltransferase subunit beta [Fusarium oxysporum f. sp. albedinis]